MTILVRHVTLQVFTHRWTKERAGANSISVPITAAPWDDAVDLIRPYQGIVSWPARKTFRERTFLQFDARWAPDAKPRTKLY